MKEAAILNVLQTGKSDKNNNKVQNEGFVLECPVDFNICSFKLKFNSDDSETGCTKDCQVTWFTITGHSFFETWHMSHGVIT